MKLEVGKLYEVKSAVQTHMWFIEEYRGKKKNGMHIFALTRRVFQELDKGATDARTEYAPHDTSLERDLRVKAQDLGKRVRKHTRVKAKS